jgi:glycerol uptake facilitator protein
MSPLQIFSGEFIGSALLILLGNGGVANVVLKQSKGNNSGWIVMALGWSMAAFLAVCIAAPVSGAHLNPAVTLALAVHGTVEQQHIPLYFAGQFSGSMAGAFLVYLTYHAHFHATQDGMATRACFCTDPAIRQWPANFMTEVIATFVLVFAVLNLAKPQVGLGAISAVPVALVVLAISLCLGGPTGCAINPARDLGPRIVYALLPIPGKSNNDWAYAWIPVAGPIAGALTAVGIQALITA